MDEYFETYKEYKSLSTLIQRANDKLVHISGKIDYMRELEEILKKAAIKKGWPDPHCTFSEIWCITSPTIYSEWETVKSEILKP